MKRQLAKLGAEATLDKLLAVISTAVEFRAGFVDTFPEDAPWESIQSPIGMPDELFRSLLARTPEESRAVLSIVAGLPNGRCIADTMTQPNGMSWEQAEGYQSLRQYDLGNAAALKLSRRQRGQRINHTYLALLRPADACPLTPKDTKLLGLLYPEVRKALRRIALPLLPGDRLLARLAHKKTLGLVLRGANGAICEVNQPAIRLLDAYSKSLPGKNHDLAAAVCSLLSLPPDLEDGCRHLSHPEISGRWLEVFVDSLDADGYGLRETRELLLFQEFLMPGVVAGGPAHEKLEFLQPRQRAVVELLVGSGLSRKEIAGHLGISVGTVRTHVDGIYLALGVHTREELTALLLRRR